MAISLEHDLSLALAARLATIRIADGWHTDMGQRVYRGRVAIDPRNATAFPCAVLVEKDDTPLDQKRNAVKLDLGYLLIGYAPCDPDQPNDAAHAIVADLKRAIFSSAEPLHPKVREIQYQGRSIMPREDGMSLVSAVVEIRIEFVSELAATQ